MGLGAVAVLTHRSPISGTPLDHASSSQPSAVAALNNNLFVPFGNSLRRCVLHRAENLEFRTVSEYAGTDTREVRIGPEGEMAGWLRVF